MTDTTNQFQEKATRIYERIIKRIILSYGNELLRASGCRMETPIDEHYPIPMIEEALLNVHNQAIEEAQEVAIRTAKAYLGKWEAEMTDAISCTGDEIFEQIGWLKK